MRTHNMKSAYPRPEDQVRRDVQKMATHFESEEPDVSCPLPGGVEHFPSDRSKEDAITTHPTLTPTPKLRLHANDAVWQTCVWVDCSLLPVHSALRLPCQ